jgi:hypothetical protein
VRQRALGFGLIVKGRGRGGRYQASAPALRASGTAATRRSSAPTTRRSTGGNGVAPEPTFQSRHPAGQHGCLGIQGLHLRVLFLKRLSDAFEEAREGA